MYHALVKPLLTHAGIVIDYVETTHAGHATALATGTFSADKHEGIVVIGGDGLIWEVVDGLVRRDDASEALLKCTLGIIPGGSGNGLAKSVLAACGEAQNAANAAFVVARGRPRPLDVAQVRDYTRLRLPFTLIHSPSPALPLPHAALPLAPRPPR